MDILSRIYDVTNLSDASFLTTSGGHTNTSGSIDDKDRTNDLVYIRLSCIIDAQDHDKGTCRNKYACPST